MMEKNEFMSIVNKTDNVIRGIIKDFNEIHRYCDKWDYNIPQISWDKLTKYEDMLTVKTKKMREAKK